MKPKVSSEVQRSDEDSAKGYIILCEPEGSPTSGYVKPYSGHGRKNIRSDDTAEGYVTSDSDVDGADYDTELCYVTKDVNPTLSGSGTITNTNCSNDTITVDPGIRTADDCGNICVQGVQSSKAPNIQGSVAPLPKHGISTKRINLIVDRLIQQNQLILQGQSMEQEIRNSDQTCKLNEKQIGHNTDMQNEGSVPGCSKNHETIEEYDDQRDCVKKEKCQNSAGNLSSEEIVFEVVDEVEITSGNEIAYATDNNIGIESPQKETLNYIAQSKMERENSTVTLNYSNKDQTSYCNEEETFGILNIKQEFTENMKIFNGFMSPSSGNTSFSDIPEEDNLSKIIISKVWSESEGPDTTLSDIDFAEPNSGNHKRAARSRGRAKHKPKSHKTYTTKRGKSVNNCQDLNNSKSSMGDTTFSDIEFPEPNIANQNDESLTRIKDRSLTTHESPSPETNKQNIENVEINGQQNIESKNANLKNSRLKVSLKSKKKMIKSVAKIGRSKLTELKCVNVSKKAVSTGRKKKNKKVQGNSHTGSFHSDSEPHNGPFSSANEDSSLLSRDISVKVETDDSYYYVSSAGGTDSEGIIGAIQVKPEPVEEPVNSGRVESEANPVSSMTVGAESDSHSVLSVGVNEGKTSIDKRKRKHSLGSSPHSKTKVQKTESPKKSERQKSIYHSGYKNQRKQSKPVKTIFTSSPAKKQTQSPAKKQAQSAAKKQVQSPAKKQAQDTHEARLKLLNEMAHKALSHQKWSYTPPPDRRRVCISNQVETVGNKSVMNENIQDDVNINKCQDCSKQFSSSRELQKHHHRKHSVVCEVCGRGFPNQKHMKGHRRTEHVRDGVFFCDQCPKTFKRSAFLVDHLKSHTKSHDALTCQICGKTFLSKGYIEKHMMRHNNIRPYKCDICNKTFTASHSLTRHREVHIKAEKHHECDQCGTKFSHLDGLRQHLVSHQTERPHGCAHCPKRFKMKATALKHEQVHSDHLPFQCGECGKAYRYKYTLQRHLISHTGERQFRCPQCPLSFALLTTLTQHEAVHRPGSDWGCTECGMFYRRKEGLRKHMRRGHGIDLDRDMLFGGDRKAVVTEQTDVRNEG